MSYIGNHLNVQFYNGGAVYHHAFDIKSFLQSWPSPNNLLKAVEEDIEVKVHLAELRALGIIDKIITGPFWRVINHADSILDLNSYLFTMKERFELWCKDASSLLNGEPLFDEDTIPIHRDQISEELFESTADSECESLTQQVFEMFMHRLLLILERQAEDQLPGGKHFIPTENVSKISSTVPSTNMASE